MIPTVRWPPSVPHGGSDTTVALLSLAHPASHSNSRTDQAGGMEICLHIRIA